MRVRPPTPKRLFLAARRVRPAARDAFVVRWSGERADVLAEVRALLANADRTAFSLRAPSIARHAVEDLADRLEAPAPAVEAKPPAAATGAARPEPLEAGGRFADFEIEEEIGAGGFGRVFRARDRLLGRAVALKSLRVRDIGPVTSADRKRFLREARALAAIVHANVAVLYRVHALDDGGLVLEMEFVDGAPLGAELGDGRRLPIDVALAVVRDLASGLRAAHAVGVVHGDVKPSNVVRARDGTVKLVDFGLARFVGAESQRSGSGVIAGTPDYMAPEVITGASCGPGADVWSLGVILHRMLAGAFPFRADSIQRLFARIVSAEPAPLPPEFGRELRGLVGGCLAKSPELRPRLDDEFLGRIAAAMRAPMPRPSVDAT